MRQAHRFVAVVVGTAGLLIACAGTPNHYRRSLGKQEQCCHALREPGAVEACLAEIPRVDSAAAETSPVNQETFACVERYFQCDGATGRATKASAQAQLDCLNELEAVAAGP